MKLTAGIPGAVVQEIIAELAQAPAALEQTRQKLPDNFPERVLTSIGNGVLHRAHLLRTERLNAKGKQSLMPANSRRQPLFTMRSGSLGDGFEHNYPLERALPLADRVRGLPERYAMRDGRQWRLIPFIIFPSVQGEMLDWARQNTHATILPPVANCHPLIGLQFVEQIFNEFQDRVLNDYVSFGILATSTTTLRQIAVEVGGSLYPAAAGSCCRSDSRCKVCCSNMGNQVKPE